MSDINIPNHEQWGKMNEYLNTIAVLLASNSVDLTPKKIEQNEKLTAGTYAGFALLTVNGETVPLIIPLFPYKAPLTGIIPLGMNYSLYLLGGEGIVWLLMDGKEASADQIDLYLVKLM